MPPILSKATQINIPAAAVLVLLGSWGLWISKAVLDLQHQQALSVIRAEALTGVQDKLGCQLDTLTVEIVKLRETMIRLQAENAH